MAYGDQTVLRCEQCNKPFDKESTLKRHGYYCRSRKTSAGKPVPRARSCISCVKRKGRCDNCRPECTTCVKKGFVCRYPTNAKRDINVRNDEAPLHPQVVSTAVPEHKDDSEARLEGTQCLDVSLAGVPNSWNSEASKEDRPFEWKDLDSAFTSFLHEEMIDPSIQVLPKPSSIPATPAQNVRSIIARPRLDKRSQRTVKLIMHTLKSYLRMMQHENIMPPFIHPDLSASHVGTGRLEPMANCTSLMLMINSEVQGSRRLFWKNVRLECERLQAERTSMTRLELLATMQALSIYIFVRLDEGLTDENNFDHFLLSTVTVVAHQLNCNAFTLAQQQGHPTELVSMWQEWVIKESINRLCLIYRIIDMLAYFEPAAMCDLPSDLLLAPLPARKPLWESSDEFTWGFESSKDVFGEAVFGLTAAGDLVKWNAYALRHDEMKSACASLGGGRDEANWEEWCSGMDGLGGLVMLAASLVG